MQANNQRFSFPFSRTHRTQVCCLALPLLAEARLLLKNQSVHGLLPSSTKTKMELLMRYVRTSGRNYRCFNKSMDSAAQKKAKLYNC